MVPQPPFSDEELRRILQDCNRRIAGHGPRTAGTMLAGIDPETPLDVYGNGGVVAELEREVATLFGKEAALFLPTGTMAQQATLRIHADRRGRNAVVFHPACHLDKYEERAYERLHGLVGIPCGPMFSTITTAALEQIREPYAALLLELPQRELGGALPTWEELIAQCALASSRGAATHLDGARIFEAATYYEETAGKTIPDIAALFDTVYLSFYKGLGGIAGCCVAGDQAVIDELKLWRIRHGGRMYQMWPYAASALTGLRTYRDRFGAYVAHARAFARAVADEPRIEVLPNPPQASMLHLRITGDVEAVQWAMVEVARRSGVWLFGGAYANEGPNLQRYELSLGEASLAVDPHEFATLVHEVLEMSDAA